MATIEIDADEPELIDVKLVGKNYLLNPPKTALTMALAESFGTKGAGNKVAPLKPNATEAEKEKHREDQAEAMRAAQKSGGKAIKGLNKWIEQAFGTDGAKEIHKRLLDPKDLLDIKHIMKLMTRMAEATTGDPST